ncbi:tryptophan synthase beta subunit-like PLP-dependent enzyme [Aspergillus affinis]|uniref:tryptophan synthase beta subunit-like PLP-dependent enzyme n=1 Tax=Aspergillus affinis TaxID=1070780 RepID=UPI0022FE7797|nr:tryptophan synthase beta subunit-like PLP-dependent enzyme [Aspergillus affinis]KAI9041798.1 tryptophan synthase beta subunit-like PLP-dependent enzyme [Aspergillus affinis]
MLPLLGSAADAIGNTPLVCLDRLTTSVGLEGTIVAKLDYLNPGGSKKDGVALGIIEEAERLGTIKPGQTVVELTSGNTGTGLSIVCAVKGYPFISVMSRGNSVERARMMSALGAEVVPVDRAPGSIPGQVSGSTSPS